MLRETREIYLATRKKHDLVFNVYFMRPIAAGVVAILARTSVTPNQITLLNLFMFVVAAAVLVAWPDYRGGLVAIGILELSYCFDCVDGMLARYKKIASKEGHLFDFFTDELKAVLLVSSLGARLYRTGGIGLACQREGLWWPSGDPRFLLAGIAGVVVIASAISMTNFLRRPEVSGRATTVEAHYETVESASPTSLAGRAAHLVTSFLRFLNHYPSHIWAFALVAKFDVFFWIYGAINLLYLGRGWLGIIARFGRAAP